MTTRSARAGGLLVLAWLAAYAAVRLGLGGVLPVVLWLGVAGLLRAGTTLLDRLLLGALLGLGLLGGLGVLFSWWPWGLDPVPVAGVALSLVVVVHAGSGRPFRLPRPRWTDLAPPVVAGAITAAVALPYLRAGDFTGRLAALMSGEDSTRHASLVDHLREAGAYPFLDPGAVSDVLNPGMADYPQGWHLVAAVLENLAASRAGLGPVEHDLTALMVLLLGTFGLLVLTVVWAAGRLAAATTDVASRAGGASPADGATQGRGTGRRGVAGQLTAVCAAGLLLVGSELVRTIVYTYAAEMFALAFLAALVAVAARPAVRTRDQIALLSALTIGVGFSYYLFLPIAALIVACAVVADRRRMRRAPGSVAVGVLLCGLAPLQALAGVLAGRRDGQLALGSLGGVRPVELALLAVLIAAGLVIGRRDPVWRRYAPAFATALLAAAAVYGYLRWWGTDPGYYFGKMLHGYVLVALVGVGAVGNLARLLPGRAARRAWAGPLGAVVVAALALAQVTVGVPTLTAVPWFSGQVNGERVRAERARTVVAVATACSTADGPPAVVFFGDPARNWGYDESIFLTVLQRTSGSAFRQAYGLPRQSAQRRAEGLLERTAAPVRVVIGDGPGREGFAAALRTHPEWRSRATVVDLDELRRTGRCTATPLP